MSLRYGRYETMRVIGSGGMAVVHLARALGEGGFERLVALKVIHPHIGNDPEFVAMFLDEARLAARIRHPNVVGTVDIQRAGENLFLVMDYIEGLSLRAILRHFARSDRRVPLTMTLRIVTDMLQGLHAAHELTGPDGAPLKLVHRDVSPHNILVGVDGVSRLTDFGVARAEWRLSSTRGSSLKGKVAYMSPEQLLATEVDRRSDVYAAAAVLWETLVGRRLFNAPNDGALVAKIIQGVDSSPREHNPDVPEAVAAVCMRGLSLKADDRYQSALEFVDALEEAAEEADLRIGSTRKVAGFIQTIADSVDDEDADGSQPSAPHASSPSDGKNPDATESVSLLETDSPAVPSPASDDDPTVARAPLAAAPPASGSESFAGDHSTVGSPAAKPPADGTPKVDSPSALERLNHPQDSSDSSHSSTSTEAVLSATPSPPRVGDQRAPPTALLLGSAAAAAVLLVVFVALLGGDDNEGAASAPEATPTSVVEASFPEATAAPVRAATPVASASASASTATSGAIPSQSARTATRGGNARPRATGDTRRPPATTRRTPTKKPPKTKPFHTDQL
jgi:serine/threonine-protein kinase